MKGNWIVVEAEVDEVVKALSETSKSLMSIKKQSVGIIARYGVKFIRKRIRETLLNKKQSTRELQKSYSFRVKKDGSEANIYPKGVSGSRIFPKAYVNNYGYEGATKRSKNWSFAPKAFVQDTENLLEKREFDTELQKMIDKTLAKYWS